MSKKENSNEVNNNREITIITYVFVGLFVLLVCNFAYFNAFQSKNIINNSYNKRQDLFSKNVIRGKILASNGEVLAETIVNDDKTETRNYPFNNKFAHVVGLSTKGKSGIESYANFSLLTSNANIFERLYKELKGEKNIGDNVVTTLDLSLQKIAYDALGRNRGAVVVMEPETGKILAMVSKPDYNPNDIDKIWDDLVEDKKEQSSLLNRATQGLYPPGSTFKILTALEFIRENPDFQNYTYLCKGKDIFNDVVINCYNNKNHGEEDLIKSFAKSCNDSFANIGINLNISSLNNLCKSFLFNSDLPLQIPYKRSSFVLDESSSISEIPQTVIGQGKTQISPMHNALIVSAIANGGKLMNPYLIDQIENYNGDVVKKYLPISGGNLLSATESGILTKLMEEVVLSGTATSLKNKKYEVAGKTGSAEYETGKAAHAWFVGFAPVENPKIVISVIVENVGTGSEYAVPIAKKIFEQYFK